MARAIPVGDAPDKTELAPYQVYLLHDRAERMIRSSFKSVLASLDLSVTEWVILNTVKDAGRQYISMSSLAAIINKPLSQTSVTAQKLIERRLLRQKTGTKDFRSRGLACTAGGKRLLFRANQQIMPLMPNFKGRITQPQYDQYLKLLSQTLA